MMASATRHRRSTAAASDLSKAPMHLDAAAGEILVPLSQVPDLPWIPRRRRGRKLHAATVFRWCQKGVKGVKLECWQFAGTKVTTVAALHRFFDELSAKDTSGAIDVPKLSAERASIEWAENQLDKIGI